MRRKKLILQYVVAAFLILFLVGANGPCDPVPPPYDTTGEYEGDWWSGEGEHCPVAIEMEMDAAPAFPALWGPAATFHVDFSCIELPPEFPPLEPIDINTVGILDENGNLIFTAIGCGIGFCVNFDSAGVGVDLDADAMMDEYSGEWAFLIMVAGFQPFGVAGEFDVMAVVPE